MQALMATRNKAGLIFSKYSGLEVRNSIIKILAPYPRKVSVKTVTNDCGNFKTHVQFFFQTVSWQLGQFSEENSKTASASNSELKCTFNSTRIDNPK